MKLLGLPALGALLFIACDGGAAAADSSDARRRRTRLVHKSRPDSGREAPDRHLGLGRGLQEDEAEMMSSVSVSMSVQPEAVCKNRGQGNVKVKGNKGKGKGGGSSDGSEDSEPSEDSESSESSAESMSMSSSEDSDSSEDLSMSMSMSISGDEGAVTTRRTRTRRVQSETEGQDMEVEIPGKFTIKGYKCNPNANLDARKKGLERAIEAKMCTKDSGCKCEAVVTRLEENKCPDGAREDFPGRGPRGLRGEDERSLQQTAAELKVEFKVTVTTFITTNDPTEAEFQANAVYESLSDALREAFINGDFANVLLTDSDLNDIFDGLSADITATFGPLVASLLEDLKHWYPASWHGAAEDTCQNDGDSPLYMKRTGHFFRDSLEECCKSFYGWTFHQCMIDGGADPAQFATGHFYVSYKDDSCKQSCLEDTPGKNCGGLAESWQELYDEAEECCEKTLFWVHRQECVAKSTLTPIAAANVGSGKYWVDWHKFQCVKDCDESANASAECGGLAKRWDQLYDDKNDCCSARLSWVAREDC